MYLKKNNETNEIIVNTAFNVLNQKHPIEYVLGSLEGIYNIYNNCKLLKQFLHRTLTDIDVIFEHKITDISDLRFLIYLIDNNYIELYEQAKEEWKVYML